MKVRGHCISSQCKQNMSIPRWWRGGCCNLLRRLHVARGEFGTILLPLWSTERSHSVRRAETLVHFHWPLWHKFPPTRWYDCQSAPWAQRGNMAGDREPQQAEPLWAFLDGAWLLFVIKHQIPRPDSSCQSFPYRLAKHVNALPRHLQILAPKYYGSAFSECKRKDMKSLCHWKSCDVNLKRRTFVAALVSRCWYLCWLIVMLS